MDGWMDGWMDHSIHETNELQGMQVRQENFFFEYIHSVSYIVNVSGVQTAVLSLYAFTGIWDWISSGTTLY
jgi:hypothetical protein